ncbi:MAG TPA: putative PEP-binding protein [Allocoleopsis sp.]
MGKLYWLDQIQSSERSLVGSKAFDLSQLLQQGGYPVVPSFVVPAIAFWEFLELLSETEPLLSDLPDSFFHVDVDSSRQLQQVAQQIRRKITTTALPSGWTSLLFAPTDVVQAPVAILHPSLSVPSHNGLVNSTFETRPSALNIANSFHSSPAGLLESHTCLYQPEALTQALKRVWAELFRARSLFYWQRHGIGIHQLNLAVLVQPLWEAIASGTIDAKLTEWNIQATWGISHALARGEVLPDTYQLHAQTGTVKTQNLGSKTRGYRLNTVSTARVEERRESDTLTANGLQAYLLSEEQQKQYALDEKYLKQLIKLSQRLAAEFTPTFSLEWMLYQTPESSEPQLFITQFLPQYRTVSAQPVMSSQSPPPRVTPQILRGLPAASGRVTAPTQVLSSDLLRQNLKSILPGRILVSTSITPDWLSVLQSAAGIVTEQGGMTSHAAIIARELGIPAVVGVTGATQLIQTGEVVAVDGDQGEIQRLASRDWSAMPENDSSLDAPSSMPYPQFPIATQLLVNLSLPNSLERAIGLPVDGVGLLRSELLMLDVLDNLHPSEWLRQGLQSELVDSLAQRIMQFAAAFTPRPVYYRSLDWRSNEFSLLVGDPSANEFDVNPVLGLHGTRRYLIDPTYFDLELDALAQVYSHGYTNVQLMLPFVRSVEEFTFCRTRVQQVGLTDHPNFQLWIMAEVPSVLFLLPDYVKAGVQGISIGTNDLTQLLLAIDRDREPLGSAMDAGHPAVRRAIEQLIETARALGIPCSICGQAPAQYPDLIDSLVKWGITSISVDINDVKSTYTAIARAEQRLILEAARKKSDR